MKLNKYILLISAIAATGLSSCVSETLGDGLEKTGTGRMALDVSLLEPQATRAESPVTNYPVTVYNAAGEEVKYYKTVADVPESEVLPVGNYVVESHTPGEIEKKMTSPYYFGTKDMEIQSGLTTDVKVVCKMQNSKITVTYDGKFLTAFKEWTITLNDGSDMALSFTQTNGNFPDPVYWWFKEEDQVEELILNFRAVTKNGDNVAYATAISKQDPTSTETHYDDDRTYFAGGDAIVLNFTAVEDTKGNITGVTVSATVTFEETNETVDLDVTDKGGFGSGDNNDPGNGDDDDPEPGEGEITLNLPLPIEIPLFNADGVDPRLGDTYIAAEEGLKSIVVKIESTSQDMLNSVEALAENYDGVDFLSGTEIVGNQELVRLFSELGQELEVPNQGDKDYTFPIGNFFTLLSVLAGEHTFTLTVVDMTGNRKSGKVVVTVQ